MDSDQPRDSEEGRVEDNQDQISTTDRARNYARRGEVSPEEREIMSEFISKHLRSWKGREIQEWVTETLRYGRTHVGYMNPVLDVDLIFTKLGRMINEADFLEWVVTFEGRIENSSENQTMICGIRFDVDQAGDHAGMVYIKLRTVGIRTMVEAYFDKLISPFSPGSEIRVRQPNRTMKYEMRKTYIKGGARFETDVYRVW